MTAGGTSLVVESATGIQDLFTIGIETDNGDIHWDILNGVVGTTLTLTTGIDYASAAGSFVYFSTAFSTARPLEIIQAWTRDQDELDIPMDIMSLQEYRSLSNKTTEGRPTGLTFDPQLDNVILYLWPEPNVMKMRVHLVAKFPVQDFDAAGNDPDFPVEWTEALVYNLAIRLAAEYGRTPSQLVVALALSSFETVASFSREEVSVKFVPNRRQYRER
jgi:hypothetical protein